MCTHCVKLLSEWFGLNSSIAWPPLLHLAEVRCWFQRRELLFWGPSTAAKWRQNSETLGSGGEEVGWQKSNRRSWTSLSASSKSFWSEAQEEQQAGGWQVKYRLKWDWEIHRCIGHFTIWLLKVMVFGIQAGKNLPPPLWFFCLWWLLHLRTARLTSN